MESFRTVIKGWLGKVLLILFLTPLALVGIEGYFNRGNKADVAKTVNGQEISKKDLETLTQSYKEQYLAAVKGDESLLNLPVIQAKALDILVSRNLLIQQAEKLGISLSDTQIEQMLAQQPSLQENGQFSQKLYENYLRSIGMTSQGLIASLRQDHALKMLTSTFSDYSLVSKVDLMQIANLQTEQRTLHLASIKLDGYKTGLTASNQEATDYYNKHQNEFKQQSSVDVDYVVVSPSLMAKPAPATEAELQQAYSKFVETQKKDAKRTVKHILITTDARDDAAAQKLAKEVYAKIQGGLTFAQAASQFSEDPSSKAKGGLVEAYAPGVFSDAFDKTVVSLKNGQISQPVKTQYGYHIIEAETQASQIPSFEAEKARLTAEVEKNKVATVYSDTVNSLNETIVGNDSLEAVVQEVKGTKVESLNGVTLATQNPYLSDPNVKIKLFNDDVKNGDRNASSNIQLANGDTVWVKVRDYHAAGVKPLAQAMNEAKAKVIDEKARKAVQAKIATMLAEFKTQPADQVVAKNKVAFESAGVFSRSQGLKREIERAAFSAATPKPGMWSVTTANLPNELVVVAVSNVNSSAANAIPADQLQQLKQLYRQSRGQQILEDYSQYLKSHAKIK
ncbi:SurA N-terminal domain-containing protein [Acinetobacter oleivorans]|uniref:SurA N-terminal domain-containing protein n=1 Tax=Acinetobacter TaxID=469 RepID=UPI00125F72FD|nr:MULTISPECIES: SurA N-terminal domain-containing protein [Acinetobacter]MBE2171501.1 SurA N-terminal domain-containing protein [Acinetobacter oleivorans]MBJ9419782.1 SurA N-terminal domain-containing protein [Acinetobacter oleivorans]MDI3454436.1 SurA N-terminal domain-containing protein [Acinetobacter sp. V89_4]MDY7371460.1 SurA N-terminal domain-containing protein [Acinetobacter oleivorans]URM39317.1 SurA N-terminal domain-containing protein [Acinetobacter sp. AS23]